ncbi:MAG: DUF5691 domain-containing protein [Bacteroidota bacterium]
MQFWNQIIHTALLGTDKKQLVPAELGPVLSAIAEEVAPQPASKEEQFLQIASLAFNYRLAGVTVLQKKEFTISTAVVEEKEYCSAAATRVLKDILLEESLPLLKFWLQACQYKKRLVTPDLLPVILKTGAAQKALQQVIIDCGGKRAEWLSQFNTDWKFSSGISREELWQTGTPEQRRVILQQLRKEDPAMALEWIQQTWPQEDANTKADFIKILLISLSENDITFLERLSNEKSKKVKDEALALLKKIPTSSIVQQYWNIIKQSLLVKKEKALLGMVNKTVLQVGHPSSIDETIFKTGIEKLSNNKEFTDEDYIAYQLMQNIPLSFYEAQWQLKPEEIIDLFQKNSASKRFLPALVLSIVHFSDERWAIFFMQYCTTFYTDIIPLLPVKQQEYYSNKFFTDQPENIIHHATQREHEWGPELAASILRHAAKSPYQYNRSFFNQHIHLIPFAIAAELERFTPTDDGFRVMWSNTSGYILKLLSLKIQTLKAFNE